MAASVNQQIYDAGVSHQIGLSRLSTANLQEIQKVLTRADRDLLRRITEYAGDADTFTRARLDRALAAVRKLNAEAASTLALRSVQSLTALASYEVDFNRRLISRALPIDWDIAVPSLNMLEAMVTTEPMRGALLSEWFDGWEAGRFNRVRDAMRLSWTEGETVPQMISRLRGTRALGYKDGVLDVSRRSAEAIVRTATNHVATKSRELLYEQNDDLIKGVRWVSTLDLRTSSICQALDGQVFDPGKGPRPPAHLNCRSCTVPILKSWEELGIDGDEIPEGTRASMDGQVPASETYQTWLARQSETVQDEVLGPERAGMFRQGTMTLDRFFDDKGRRYTLDELRARETAAIIPFPEPKIPAVGFHEPKSWSYVDYARNEKYFDELVQVIKDTEIPISKAVVTQNYAGTWAAQHALGYYGSAGYMDINDLLRTVSRKGESLPPPKPLKWDQSRIIGVLDRVFEDAAPIGKDIVVWRGVRVLPTKLEVGSRFAEPGFSSTSLSPGVASSFATSDPSSILLRITLRPPQKAVILGRKEVSAVEVAADESEVLLPRGTTFVVRGISQINGRTAYDLEIE